MPAVSFKADEYTMNWLIKTAHLNGVTLPKMVEACVGFCITAENFHMKKYGDERRDRSDLFLRTHVRTLALASDNARGGIRTRMPFRTIGFEPIL